MELVGVCRGGSVISFAGEAQEVRLGHLPHPSRNVLVAGGAVFGEEFAAGAGALGIVGQGEDFGAVHESVDHGGIDRLAGEGFSFFTDLCTWGTEPGSPLTRYMPVVVPLTAHDLNRGGFTAARARTAARMTATVMDLNREIPNIRAFALRRWHEAAEQLASEPNTPPELP